MKTGIRVVIVSKGHPWSGHAGKYLGIENTMVGRLHKIELDNGMRCMVSSLADLQEMP